MFITVFEGGFFILRDKTIDTPLINWLLCSFTRENTPSFDGVFSLVSHVDITWNSFLPYLIQLTDKLEALGFRYVDNKVIVLQEKADEK